MITEKISIALCFLTALLTFTLSIYFARVARHNKNQLGTYHFFIKRHALWMKISTSVLLVAVTLVELLIHFIIGRNRFRGTPTHYIHSMCIVLSTCTLMLCFVFPGTKWPTFHRIIGLIFYVSLYPLLITGLILLHNL
jgi:hypothetical protein